MKFLWKIVLVFVSAVIITWSLNHIACNLQKYLPSKKCSTCFFNQTPSGNKNSDDELSYEARVPIPAASEALDVLSKLKCWDIFLLMVIWFFGIVFARSSSGLVRRLLGESEKN